MPERADGKVGSSRACMEGPPNARHHSDWQGHTPQSAALQGTYPSITLCWGTPKQGHGAWAMWMLAGCLLRRREDRTTTLTCKFQWHLLMSHAWILVILEDAGCRREWHTYVDYVPSIFNLKKTRALKCWQDFQSIPAGIWDLFHQFCNSLACETNLYCCSRRHVMLRRSTKG